MKALSLQQPWATLVVLGRKRFETRTWHSEHRGSLLIHAAKRFPPSVREMCRSDPVHRLLTEAGFRYPSDLPRGVLLGTVQLCWCRRSEEMNGVVLSEADRLLGDFRPGRWAWLLEQATPLAEPVPWRGRLGIFDVPDLPALTGGLDHAAFSA